MHAGSESVFLEPLEVSALLPRVSSCVEQMTSVVVNEDREEGVAVHKERLMTLKLTESVMQV